MNNKKTYSLLSFSIVLCLIFLCFSSGCIGTDLLSNLTPKSPITPAVTTITTTEPIVTETAAPIVTEEIAEAPVVTTIETTLPTTTPKIESDANLTVSFINVGQGDSEWIVSPSGKTMLIDAEESTDAKNVTAVIKDIDSIDVVVATHPHSDHIAGMETIFNTYNVTKFYDNGFKYTSAMYTHMMKVVDEKNISHSSVKRGDYIAFDPLVNVSVLNPQEKFFTELNDNSVVMLMKYKNVSILFTGDAGLNAESIYAKTLTRVNVLKVSHHGSTTGTGSYLLSKIQPTISVISVGADNNYGHPDKATMSKLTKNGFVVYRTDLNGTVVVTTDGEQYSVSSVNN